jgi:hypothetical protein
LEVREIVQTRPEDRITKKGGNMRKAGLFAITVVLALGFFTLSFADKPQIADLVMDDVVKASGSPQTVKLAFVSDQRPEDVNLQFFGYISGRTNRSEYSGKDLTVQVVEREGGGFAVTVVREIRTPPFSATAEVTIFVKVGKIKSNELKKEIRFEP